MVDATTVSGTRPILRRKMLSSFQEGAMHEALHTLRKLRAGYVSAMTNACSQIDILLVDYANLVKVKSLQSTLDKAWRNFQENVTRCKSLLDENSDEIYEVDTQYATQETKSISVIRRLSNTQLPPPHISTNKYLMILTILEWHRQQDLSDPQAVVLLQSLVRQAQDFTTRGLLRLRLR